MKCSTSYYPYTWGHEQSSKRFFPHFLLGWVFGCRKDWLIHFGSTPHPGFNRHHQKNMTFLGLGIPILNRHLPMESWMGNKSNIYFINWTSSSWWLNHLEKYARQIGSWIIYPGIGDCFLGNSHNSRTRKTWYQQENYYIDIDKNEVCLSNHRQ